MKKKGSADLLTRSLKFVTSDDQYLYFKAYKYFNKLQTEVGKDEREVSMKVNMFIKCSLLHFPQDIVEKYISNIYINYIDFLWSKKINICSGYLTCSSLSVVFPTCCLLSCYSVKVLTYSTSVVFQLLFVVLLYSKGLDIPLLFFQLLFVVLLFSKGLDIPLLFFRLVVCCPAIQ